ncbi:MAG: TauD/TfdA family dioxygenase [Pseudomonadota bacterium]
MSDNTPLPRTPDFDSWPLTQQPTSVAVDHGALLITWSDARTSAYHPFLLAENDPAEDTLHPLSRETTLSPLDLPCDLVIRRAVLLANGAVEVHWSHGRAPSRFHPGWLRGIAWFGEHVAAQDLRHWSAADLSGPPTLNGPRALAEPPVFLEWLLSLQTHGLARLSGLPNQDGLLAGVVARIGPIRESNFGRQYTLEIKEDPDSNAFTSDALLQHMDLPTRECPHGLQFLFCRANTARGGEGIYVDAYRIAEDLKSEEPDQFATLCEINWTYKNRAKSSSYKAAGPVIERDRHGTITAIRYNTWLRSPLVAALADQDRAYRAYRAFTARAQDPAYQMIFSYRPGDLLAFDNRRILHGRKGYDATGGTRFIEGTYADRDDLHSAIRTLERHLSRELAS